MIHNNIHALLFPHLICSVGRKSSGPAQWRPAMLGTQIFLLIPIPISLLLSSGIFVINGHIRISMMIQSQSLFCHKSTIPSYKFHCTIIPW